MVREFYNKYYSANLMTSSIYGNLEMDDLMALADSTLSSVGNYHKEAPDFANPLVAAYNEANLVRTV